MAVKNTGTTIICNGCTGIDSYNKTFPALNQFKTENSFCCFDVEKNDKYFIQSDHFSYENLEQDFLIALIKGCSYGHIGDDPQAMAIFDDNSWNSVKGKFSNFWELSHTKCQIIITCQDLSDLLNVALDHKMKKDISKYWNIIYCEKLL